MIMYSLINCLLLSEVIQAFSTWKSIISKDEILILTCVLKIAFSFSYNFDGLYSILLLPVTTLIMSYSFGFS